MSVVEKTMYSTRNGRVFDTREEAEIEDKKAQVNELIVEIENEYDDDALGAAIEVLKYIRDNKINSVNKIQSEIEYFAEIREDQQHG